MTNAIRMGAACCAVLLLAVTGCSEENPNLQGTIVLTHTEKVRSWLEGVAQRGQLDSGVMVMEEEIAALKEEGVTEADALAADFAKLKNAKGPGAIRSQAKAMLKKLPPPETISRTEE